MADILPSNAPAPNATSDMPQIVPPTAPDTVPFTPPAAPETPPVAAPVPAQPEQHEPIKVRISEIAAQRREAEARAARFEGLVAQQAEQLREALAAVQKLTTPVVTPPPVSEASSSFSEPRPVREAYADPESYETALVSWAGQKAAFEASSAMREQQEQRDREQSEREAAEKKAAEEQTQREQQEKIQAETMAVWNERRAKTAEKYEDFAEVAESPALAVSMAMAHTLMHAEDGAEILYYLGKHPEEASRIAAMIVPGQVFPANMGPLSGSPVPDGPRQAYELGKIATKLGLEIAPSVDGTTPPANALAPDGAAVIPLPDGSAVIPPAITVLPTPPQPISGASTAAIVNSTDLKAERTMEEYARLRIPQLQAQRSPSRRQLQ